MWFYMSIFAPLIVDRWMRGVEMLQAVSCEEGFGVKCIYRILRFTCSEMQESRFFADVQYTTSHGHENQYHN